MVASGETAVVLFIDNTSEAQSRPVLWEVSFRENTVNFILLLAWWWPLCKKARLKYLDLTEWSYPGVSRD